MLIGRATNSKRTALLSEREITHEIAKPPGITNYPGISKQTLLAMKLTAIFLFTVCLTASANGLAQTVSLSERNAPLQKVFNKIEQQTGYSFVYRTEWLNEAKTVTLEVKNGSLQHVLDLCFKDQPFTYAIVDRIIVVKQKEVQTLPQNEANLNLPPPVVDVRGRVVNENGDPLEGVSVSVRNTRVGTSTNANGEFELKGIGENSVLSFTGVTIEPLIVNLNGRKELNVTAKTRISVSEDIIINKGYYTEKQKLSTGNVSTIKSEDIDKQPVTNVLQALEGRVPGLLITQQSGVPGGGYTVLIRGKSSIANSSEPLYVVDGIPYPGQDWLKVANIPSAAGYGNNGTPYSPLNFINPADVESIDVLKDADATSIYGSRGANGVVLITTKKGKPGTTSVDINAYKGIGQIARRMQLLNGEQYIAMRKEALANDHLSIGAADYDLNGSWGNTSHDWQQELIGGQADYTNLQASITGGTNLLQFKFTGGYHRETTLYSGDYSEKKGFGHFNITNLSQNRKFRMDFSGDYTVSEIFLPGSDFASDILTSPIAPNPFDSLGRLNWASNTFGNPFASTLNVSKGFTKNLVASNTLSYEIIPGLEVKSNLSYNLLQLNDFETFPISSYYPALNRTTGNTNFSYNTSRAWNFEPQANYSKGFRKARLNATVGTTIQSIYRDGFTLNATGYPDDALLENLAAASTIGKGRVYNLTYHYQAVFSRLGFTYDDKYVFNATARRDGSSRFGPDKQFHDFGSLSGAWVFSSEKFIQRLIPALNYGKLRVSYGSSGNDQINDYRFLDLYTFTTYTNPYQGTQGLFPANLFNSDLAWESRQKAEAALELGLFKDRIFTTVAYFRDRSSNQLVKKPLPAFTGFASIDANLPAVVQNAGWEITLRTVNVKRKDVSWVVNANITISKNKLIAYPDLATSTYKNSLIIGQPLSIVRLYDYRGVDPQTGLYIFRASNGKDTSKPNSLTDRTTFVTPDPDFYGGVQSSLTYHNFSLDLFVQFVKQIGNNPLFVSSVHPGVFLGLSSFNSPVGILDGRWQKPGDVATIQKFSTSTADPLTAYSAMLSSKNNWVNASYVRLKNLSIAYRLPEAILKRMHLKNLRFYIQGENLFTITPYKGMDPETFNTTIPPLRVWTGGLQITL